MTVCIIHNKIWYGDRVAIGIEISLVTTSANGV